jgi:tetratricopeptide (TPR) repeat protein
MLPLPDGRTFLRWTFLALGLGIVSFPEFTVYSVLRAPHWAALLYPGDARVYTYFMDAAYGFAGLTPLLCVATFFGLRRNKSWGRWTGAAASSLLLLGFPLLTAAGVVGLYALFAKPLPSDPRHQPAPAPPATAAAGPWSSGRGYVAQPFMSGIAMIFGFQGLALLTLYAQRNGMPVSNPSWAWCAYFFLFLFGHAAIHEFGHAGMAWTVFFRVRLIAIGPFTFWNDGYGYQFRLEWKRLLDSRGYLGAVPVSADDLLFKQIAVIAGGPLLSLVAGGLFLLAFLALPGTAWEAAWLIVAFNAVVGLGYAVMSLLPLGGSDGAMLYHLLSDTPAGRELMGHIELSLVQEQAAAAHSRADFQKEVELREVALRLTQEGRERDSMGIALGHQTLGHALLALEDWPRAQTEFLKCLEFAAECDLDPSLRANSWLGLQEACVERYWVAEAARAGSSAVKAIGERKPARHPAGLAVSRITLAQAHLRAGAYEAALAEATGALAILPRSRDCQMLRAAIFSVQAQAHVSLGAEGAGIAATREAAAILNSHGIPEPSRNLAIGELGELGYELWRNGQSSAGIDLMRLAERQLESGGAAVTAAQFRIKLAAALRASGRQAEAMETLPAEPADKALPRSVLRSLLGERAELYLAAGHPLEAVADARALLALWQPEAAAEGEIAAAEALLARACLEAGNPAEAEPLARHAVSVLVPWGHPDAASCCITLALATRERSRGVFADALHLLESTPLLSAAERTRRLEAERARIDHFGPIEGVIAVESPMQLAGD